LPGNRIGLQKQERGEIDSDLPCAGITLIRFYGFDLSLGLCLSTPGTDTKINQFCCFWVFLLKLLRIVTFIFLDRTEENTFYE
jgi:hypothetical protein